MSPDVVIKISCIRTALLVVSLQHVFKLLVGIFFCQRGENEGVVNRIMGRQSLPTYSMKLPRSTDEKKAIPEEITMVHKIEGEWLMCLLTTCIFEIGLPYRHSSIKTSFFQANSHTDCS